MLPEKHKLKYIEGIRGLAAIIVVLHHYTLAFYPALNFGNAQQAQIGNGNIELLFACSPLNIIYNGGFAVCIFFILSGYVLSNKYHQTNNPKFLIEYAIKRYFRLLVPVAASIILAYMLINSRLMYNADLGAVTKTNDWLSGAFNQSGNIVALIKNMFVDVFFFKDNTYNPVLWTMTYELLGSFLIFFFLLIIHPFKYKMILYGLLIIILLATENSFYAAFILGVALNKYVIWQQSQASKVISMPSWAIILMLLIGLFFSSYPMCIDINNTMYGVISFSFLKNDEFYRVIGSSIIMFAILHSVKMQHILSKKIFSYIGKISFSFYLLHFIIMCSASCYLFTQFYQIYNYHSSVLLSFLCSLPIIIGSAALYYRWIDKSGILLSEKVLRLFFPKTERS